MILYSLRVSQNHVAPSGGLRVQPSVPRPSPPVQGPLVRNDFRNPAELAGNTSEDIRSVKVGVENIGFPLPQPSYDPQWRNFSYQRPLPDLLPHRAILFQVGDFKIKLLVQDRKSTRL